MLSIHFTDQHPLTKDTCCMVIPCDKTTVDNHSWLTFPNNPPALENWKKDFPFSSLPGTAHTYQTYYSGGQLLSRWIIAYAFDDIKKASVDDWRQLMGNVARLCRDLDCIHLGLALHTVDANHCPAILQALGEGWEMGNYHFMLSSNTDATPKPNNVSKVTIASFSSFNTSLEKHFHKGQHIGQAVNTARTLANLPANRLTPSYFLEQAETTFKDKDTVTLHAIDQKEAKALGMNAFLGVAQGSAEPAYMLALRYQPKKKSDKAPIALVGKGVTFDSGGISIKPSKSMSDMKGDMSGAAAVFAVLKAAVALDYPHPLLVMIPVTENMPSGTAQRPGDIVTAMNGTTIEIINTNAEGRVILPDALCYAVTQQPSMIVDIATLTGACTVALGTFVSGIMGNNQAMVDDFLDISQQSGERLWQLPLFDEYKDYLKSNYADIMHCSEERAAGTITAAKFLEQFVSDVPWVHLDVASTMDNKETKGYHIKGMAGPGVRNILYWLLSKV